MRNHRLTSWRLPGMTPKSLPGGCWKPDEQILAAIVDVNREEFCGSFDRALDVIEAAMDARRIALPRKRRTAIDVGIDLGPDHSAALTAVESLIKMMTAGRPRPK